MGERSHGSLAGTSVSFSKPGKPIVICSVYSGKREGLVGEQVGSSMIEGENIGIAKQRQESSQSYFRSWGWLDIAGRVSTKYYKLRLL